MPNTQKKSFRNKKLFSTALLGVTLMSLLSGCIAKEQPKKVEKAQNVTLVYYKLFDDEDVMKPIIQQYRASHPNVEIIYKKFTDPVEYENLIINELAEGEGPDIFSMPNSWFLRNTRKVSPMPTTMMAPADFEQNFVTVAKDDLILRDPADSQDKIFGIPFSVDTLALYFNKSQYNDKIPSQGRPAATWEGLKEDVYKLTKKDNSFERFEVAGVAMGRSDNVARAIDILYMLMLQYNVDFYNANYSQAQFTKQKAVNTSGIGLNPSAEALKLYTSFALPTNKNYSWNAYLSDSKSAVKEMDTFARGKVSMVFGYSYLYDQIAAQIKDLKDKGVNTIDTKDIGISVVPQVNDPKTSTEKRVAFANYYAETVSRTSKNPDAAWDFLLFASSKENLQYYNEKTHRPTSRRDMIEDQMKDPIYGVFAEQIGFAESLQVYDAARYQLIFSQAIDSVLATVAPTEAMRTAEDQINTLLPKDGLVPPAPKEESAEAKLQDAKKEAATSKTTKTTQQ